MDPIKKELSIGTIITDGTYILGCLPSGKKDGRHSYDLPKGHWEKGETYIETAVRECKEETGFELWPDHLVDLGRYEYIPTKDLYIFLIALDFMPDLSTLTCTTYFDLKGKKVPEVSAYKLIPITELDWFFKSLEPVVDAALNNFDSHIEEDEKAIVALPSSSPTEEESLNSIRQWEAIQEDRYSDVRSSGVRRSLINPIIYRDIASCTQYKTLNSVLVSTPGPEILEHIEEHQEMFDLSLEQLYYAEIKRDVYEKQMQQLQKADLANKVHLVHGDVFDLIKYLKSIKKHIMFIDFDGTDSSYLGRTDLVDELLRYTDSVFLAAETRGVKFSQPGRPANPIVFPSGGTIPRRSHTKPNYLKWLDSLYKQGYTFSATRWPNKSFVGKSSAAEGAPMLGILFSKKANISTTFKVVVKASDLSNNIEVYDYSFEAGSFNLPNTRKYTKRQ